MKKKRLVYIAHYNENGETLQDLLVKIIKKAYLRDGLKISYLPQLHTDSDS